MEEQWLRNNRYPGYEISEYGEIRRISKQGRSYGPDYNYDHKRNILTSDLRNNIGVTRKVSLPRLMAETFHGGPHDDREVIQLDGDIYNLNASNIAWSDEISNNPDALYDPVYKIQNRETGQIYDSIYECAEDLSVSLKSIKRCIDNPRYITKTRNHLDTIKTEEVRRRV